MQRSTPPRFGINEIVRHRSTQRQGRILDSFWVPELGGRNYHVRVVGGQPPEQVWREEEILSDADPLPSPGSWLERVLERWKRRC